MADDKKMVVMEKRSSTPGISPEVSDHGTKSDLLKSPKDGALPTFLEILNFKHLLLLHLIEKVILI